MRYTLEICTDDDCLLEVNDTRYAYLLEATVLEDTIQNQRQKLLKFLSSIEVKSNTNEDSWKVDDMRNLINGAIKYLSDDVKSLGYCHGGNRYITIEVEDMARIEI